MSTVRQQLEAIAGGSETEPEELGPTLEQTPAQASTPQGDEEEQSGLSVREQLESLKSPEYEEPPESLGKEVLRTAVQFPLGLLEKVSYPLNLIDMLLKPMRQNVLSEFEDDQLALQHQFPEMDFHDPIKGNKEQEEIFNKTFEKGQELFPTQQKLESFVEEQTGLPLVPKTRLQHLLRLGSLSASLTSGTSGARNALGQAERFFLSNGANPAYVARESKRLLKEIVNPSETKAALKMLSRGVAAPTIAQGLVEAGVPESVADPIGLMLAQFRPREAAKSGKEVAKPQPPKLIDGPPIRKLITWKEPSFMEKVNLATADGKTFASEYQAGEAIRAQALKDAGKIEGPNASLASRVNEAQTLDSISTGVPQKEASLAGRVVAEGKGVTVRFEPLPENPTPKDLTGRIFSKNTYETTVDGGLATKGNAIDIDDNVYRNMSKLYDVAEELSEGISDIREDLVGFLQEDIAKKIKIPTLSDPDKKLLASQKELLESLVTLDTNGNVTGYRPIENNVLYDQQRSLRKVIDYTFAHGNQWNVYKPTIGAIGESIERAAKAHPEALAASKEANAAYRSWQDIFNNDLMRSVRDTGNTDYSTLYKGLLNIDAYRRMVPVLSSTHAGRQNLAIIQRQIVEKELTPFLKNLKGASQREIREATSELAAIMGRDDLVRLRSELNRLASVRKPFAGKNVTPPSKIPFEGEPGEKIAKRLNTISGIRELDTSLGGTAEGRAVLKDAKEFKATDILLEGKNTAPSKPDQILNILNTREKTALLEELIGKSRVDDLREIAANQKKILKVLSKSDSRIADDVRHVFSLLESGSKLIVRPGFFNAIKLGKKLFSKETLTVGKNLLKMGEGSYSAKQVDNVIKDFPSTR